MSEPSLRDHALAIFGAALSAADPREAIRRNLRADKGILHAGRVRYRLDSFRRVIVLGAGKASAAMAQALEDLLGDRIVRGLLNVKYGHVAPLCRVELNECGHPVPDEQGVSGSRRIAALAESCESEDLVICLVSGGASALLPLPAPPVTLAEKQETTKLLLRCGADIGEMNTVRKHLSAIKGGQLARLAAPARLLTLILSDVIGDRLDVIGSGPTVPDSSSFREAVAVFEKYRLLDALPDAVRDRLFDGAAGLLDETPKPGDSLFLSATNLVVGSNRLAVDAAAAEARERGFRPLVLSTFVEGETRDVALVHAAIVREILATGRPVRRPACLISGGETTVTIKGHGLGGRNQEFALAAGIALSGIPDVLAMSGGTDGTDGPTDAAGAIADGTTFERAASLGLDPDAALADNDSYHFFDRLGDLVKTGPTNTNVMDVRLLLVG